MRTLQQTGRSIVRASGQGEGHALAPFISAGRTGRGEDTGSGLMAARPRSYKTRAWEWRPETPAVRHAAERRAPKRPFSSSLKSPQMGKQRRKETHGSRPAGRGPA